MLSNYPVPLMPRRRRSRQRTWPSGSAGPGASRWPSWRGSSFRRISAVPEPPRRLGRWCGRTFTSAAPAVTVHRILNAARLMPILVALGTALSGSRTPCACTSAAAAKSSITAARRSLAKSLAPARFASWAISSVPRPPTCPPSSRPPPMETHKVNYAEIPSPTQPASRPSTPVRLVPSPARPWILSVFLHRESSDLKLGCSEAHFYYPFIYKTLWVTQLCRQVLCFCLWE